jgi:integrase/recombinase XerD
VNKLKILSVRDITFKEGCELYLDNCRERNLREGTIEHYKNSYKQLYKFFNPNMPISQINSDMYKKYVLYLRERISNDVSINAYLRDFITTMRFLMSEEYVPHFKLRAIKVDKPNVETYTEEELNCLLQKPNIKKCNFIEYQAWVMTSFLFSTGVRQRSLINILIKDIDFDNDIVHVNVTKNRKPLLVPINMTMSNILREFLKHRQHKNTDEYLFCNVFGKQLVKSTCYTMLYTYNKQRGIQKTGIHRYRHTFAKQWILNGGNVVSLSKILGHSSLQITQNYINLLVCDLSKQVKTINLLDRFGKREKLKMR